MLTLLRGEPGAFADGRVPLLACPIERLHPPPSPLNSPVVHMEGSDDRMSEYELVRIAREACHSRGIVWREPHEVREGWRWWRVLAPADRRGSNVIVMIARKSDRVKVRFYPR